MLFTKEIAPCKGCEYRHIDCHSTCQEYNGYIQRREAIREKYRKEQLLDVDFRGYKETVFGKIDSRCGKKRVNVKEY